MEEAPIKFGHCWVAGVAGEAKAPTVPFYMYGASFSRAGGTGWWARAKPTPDPD